jgi:hypothetical protein
VAKVWLDPAQYQIDLDRLNKKVATNTPVGQETLLSMAEGRGEKA